MQHLLTDEEYQELISSQSDAYDYKATQELIEKLTKENEELTKKIKVLEETGVALAREKTAAEARSVEIQEEDSSKLQEICNNAIHYMRMKSRQYSEKDIEEVHHFFEKYQSQK